MCSGAGGVVHRACACSRYKRKRRVAVTYVCLECLDCGVGQLFYWRHACCVLVSSNILHEVANQPHVSITSANRLAHNCVQIAHACSVAMDYIAWVYRPTREAALDLSQSQCN